MSRKRTRKLKRTKQCANCPWKKSTKHEDIDRREGFDVEYYKSVRDDFVSRPGFIGMSQDHDNMGCHKHPDEDDVPCIGWLAHEVGPGNNIGLRLWLTQFENSWDIETVGEQHKSIYDFFGGQPDDDDLDPEDVFFQDDKEPYEDDLDLFENLLRD